MGDHAGLRCTGLADPDQASDECPHDAAEGLGPGLAEHLARRHDRDAALREATLGVFMPHCPSEPSSICDRLNRQTRFASGRLRYEAVPKFSEHFLNQGFSEGCRLPGSSGMAATQPWRERYTVVQPRGERRSWTH